MTRPDLKQTRTAQAPSTPLGGLHLAYVLGFVLGLVMFISALSAGPREHVAVLVVGAALMLLTAIDNVMLRRRRRRP